MIVVGATVFLTVSAAATDVVTFAVDGDELSVVPDGSLPAAVAVLEIAPASRSACVTVYVAVQVTLKPGASAAAPAGQFAAVSVPAPVKVPSLIPTFFMVTLPRFLTRNE